MNNIRVAFDILENDQRVEPGRTYLDCYMIFEVKMDFRRKTRYVANGAKTPYLTTTSYAGVVSRESVRIAFTLAALNELNIMAGDILNAYLEASISEKYWTICGPEFGKDLEESKAHIVRAIYGTKCAGKDFRNHLREYMKMLNYEPCLADPDLWMRPAVHTNGSEYYEYVLLHVDDALVVSEFPKEAIMQINKCFPMKPGSLGEPTNYLGGKISKVQISNGVITHALSMSQYVRDAIKNVEQEMKKKSIALFKRVQSPFTYDYAPELDKSKELTGDDATYYQSLIGVLK